MPRRVSSPIFVGRVAERAALAEALERAAAGQPGVVLITGEAGIGKSRLLAETATLAVTNGTRPVGGICVDVAVGTLAYAPFVEIIRDLHRGGSTKELPAATQAELARVVSEVGAERRESPGGGQGGQGRLFAAIRDLLGAAAASTPILVTIEDLHWADAATLDLVTYLARSIQSERFLLVATSRLDTLPRRHPLIGIVAELSRLPWLERIDLARFDESELVQQLTGILGRVPDPGLAHEIFERSDGNAFFAEELIATGAVGGSPLPASLREVLAARLAALDDVTQRVVRVAAVAGRVVGHDLLEQVAGVPPPVLITALREAVDQRVLLHVGDPAPGYAFRHALLREAAHDELLEAERITVHRAIADALERDTAMSPAGELARTGEIAYHAMAAGDSSRALTASLAAVVIAEQSSAHAEAEVHLGRMLDLWPRVTDAADRIGMDRAEVLARTAAAAAAAGHQSRAVGLAEHALAALHPEQGDRRIAILLELFDYAWEAADIEAAERAVSQAMSMVEGEWTGRSGRAFTEAAFLHWHHGRYGQAGEASRRAMAISRESGAQRELARALTTLGQVLTHTGETNHAEVAFAEAAGILDEVSDPVLRTLSTRWRAWARTVHGHFEESLSLNLLGLEAARRDGTDGRYGVHLLDGALENLIELGRWDEARTVGDQILARMSTSLEMVGVYMSLARLHTLQGRPADAEDEIARAATIPAVGPHRLWQLEDAIFLAYATGRHADGRALMETAIADSLEPERDAILWWALLKAIGGEADHADAARRRRRAVDAEEAVAAGRRFADLLRRSVRAAIAADGAGPMARADLSSAEAEASRLEGRSDAALWAAAVDARVELDQPWELAYARYRRAEALLATGGSARGATDPLREAHVVASELGAEPLRIAIEALAARARIPLEVGPDVRSTPVSGLATTLSARELEVLGLVAAGHTNREIGARLFISEKTASVHVTHAMDKLGALSRYEAAAMATRLGLLDAVGPQS